MRMTCGGAAVMAAAVAVVTACGGLGDLSDSRMPSVAPVAPSVPGYRVLGPGPFIAGFPEDPLDMQADLVIERGWDLAIGASADEIYVLDTSAGHVLSLDRDAGLRAVIGGPGGGPGEFEGPHSIEADPRGGVWVADLRLNRLSRFDPDGHLLQEIQVPQLVRGFAVLPDGAVLYRNVQGRAVSLAVQSGDNRLDLAGELPPELAPADVRSLLAEYDIEFAVVAPDTVVAFRNTDVTAYGAWRIALDLAAARITDIAPVAFPAWLTEAVASEAEAIKREARAAAGGEGRPGMVRSVIPFSRGVRISSGDLWVTPMSAAHLALATTIPLSVDDSVSVVARGDYKSPSSCFGLDYAVVGQRLVELCMDQVRIYELLPGAPGPPPFATRSR